MSQTVYSPGFAKVTGIVSETIELLRIWTPGMGRESLIEAITASGALGKPSADRVSALVKRAFFPRYVGDRDRPAVYLKRLVERGAGIPLLKQLFMIHTARSSAFLSDVIESVVRKHLDEHIDRVSKPELLRFIRARVGTLKLPTAWSDEVTDREGRGLIKVLADFGLLENTRTADRKVTLPVPLDETIRYIVYEARERGLADNGIVELPDWRLFGFRGMEAAREIVARSSSRFYIAQFSGDLLKVSYLCTTMEEFLDVLAG